MIAVTYFKGNNVGGKSGRVEEIANVARIHDIFPGATIVPINFRNGGFDVSGILDGWFKKLNNK